MINKRRAIPLIVVIFLVCIVNSTPELTVLIISHRETQIKNLRKITLGACAS